jgi:gliding motility-associated-like protein
MLVLSGDAKTVRKQLSELRLKMGEDLGLRDRNVFKPLWVVDFPLLEWDEETKRFHAMHHPFTSPKREDIPLLESDPGAVRANAYDLVINGVENSLFDPAEQGVGVHELFLEYTSEIGCYNNISKFVYVAPMPQIVLNLSPEEDCPPLSYMFSAETIDGGSCVWDFGNGSSFTSCAPVSQTYLQPGCYSPTFSATNEYGCTSDTTIVDLICVYTVPDAQFTYHPNPLTIFQTEASFINFSTNATSYTWEFFVNGNLISTNDSNPSYSFPEGLATYYPVTLFATSEDGCVDSITHVVVIEPDIIIYVPNTFTPDGDKFNEKWFIYIDGIDIYDFELIVFNRWGEIVWESRNPNKGWDGNYNGKPVPDGAYIWQISAKQMFIDKRHVWRGHLNVLR